MSKEQTVKRGQELDLSIEKFADKGKSLSRMDGFVVFVPWVVPGDRARVQITRRKKQHAEARLLELLEPSPLRTEPRCGYFGVCGGCRWQHVRYEEQLEAKRRSVEEALVHQGGLQEVEVPPTLGCDRLYRYRNKMEYSFSADRWLTKGEIESGEDYDKGFALGLHVPGNFYKVLDLHECHLPSERVEGLLHYVRNYVRERALEPWDIRANTGYLRHLGLREGERTGEIMVNLVTSEWDGEGMADFADHLQREHPEVTTLVNTINRSVAQVATGEETRVLYGPGLIRDRIGAYEFRIWPETFFQTNTAGAEKLYEIVREFAEPQPEDRIYDLYCGVGGISLFLSGDVSRIVGIESIEAAVEGARLNAEENGVDNCRFLSGEIEKTLTPELVEREGHPDMVIADPPRAGMHPKVVQRLLEISPDRIVYVSCNPQTQARDISTLLEGYTVEATQPVDLFPHTQHIENVALLRRR